MTQGILTGSSTIPSSTRVNTNLSYSLVGTLTVGLKGTVAFPLWFRGYHTSPGDLDNVVATTNYPTITAGTSTLSFSGNQLTISSFIFTGARSGATISASSGDSIQFRRCVMKTTSSNSAAAAFASSGLGTVLTACYLTAPSTANAIATSSSQTGFFGCYFAGAGGATTVGLAASGNLFVSQCTFAGLGSHGITYSNNAVIIIDQSTFSACGGDAIRITGNLSGQWPSRIANCAFASSGGYNINNTGTGDTCVMLAYNLNGYPNAGTAHLNGFGDTVEMGATVAGAAAYVDAGPTNSFVSGSDLHLVSTSAGAGTGLPGKWEGL